MKYIKKKIEILNVEGRRSKYTIENQEKWNLKKNEERKKRRIKVKIQRIQRKKRRMKERLEHQKRIIFNDNLEDRTEIFLRQQENIPKAMLIVCVQHLSTMAKCWYLRPNYL